MPDNQYLSVLPKNKQTYSDHIGILVGQLEISRTKTLKLVENLTLEELDYCPSMFTNSIGKLLKHIATTERLYQIDTFLKREMTREEFEEMRDGLGGIMISYPTKGHELPYYHSILEKTRQTTLNELKSKDDDWLSTVTQMRNKTYADNWYKWFHVVEDEIFHCGQITLLKKNLPK